MKITFGGFFRNTPATIMRCGLTCRLARTHPTHARSSGLETLSRSRSLAGYTIDTHESEFSEATAFVCQMESTSHDPFATLAACGCGRIGRTHHNLAGNGVCSRAGAAARQLCPDLAFGQLSRRSARR